MAPFLLDRTVAFLNHPLETEPPRGGGGAEGMVGGTIVTPRFPLDLEAEQAAVGEYLRAMKPDLQVVQPPGVSQLTMVRPLSSDPIPKVGRCLPSGFVAAADKNLVVLYAGTYRPASSMLSGWYLLLDLESSSSRPPSTIPGVPLNLYTLSYKSAGYGTVVMALPPRDGGFILAELLFNFRRPVKGLSSCELYYWHGRISQWHSKSCYLPAQVCHAWRVHMSFPVQSRNLLCWVDLLHGLLLCDVGRHCCGEAYSHLEMSFIPLPPESCQEYDQRRMVNPEDSRTMACVDGTIKFLAMYGFEEGTAISLITYTLHLDWPSPSWTKDTVLHLDDLWADETYISKGMPRITPMFPILSTQEHGIVYLVIPGDVERVEGCRVRRCNVLLSVDMRKARVVSTEEKKENHPRTLFSSRYIITFNVSQLGSKYHQRAVEAIGMGPSGKKIKFDDLHNRIL